MNDATNGYIDELNNSLRALIGAVTDAFNTSNTINTKNISDTSDNICSALAGISNKSSLTLLWSSSTTLTAGNSCTLSDDLFNYHFAVFELENCLTRPFCAIIDEHIRAGASFAGTNSIEQYAVRASYTQLTYSLLLDCVSALIIATSGTTSDSVVTGIKSIWGIR